MTRPEKKKALYAMQRQDEKRCEGIYLNWYWGGGGGGGRGGLECGVLRDGRKPLVFFEWKYMIHCVSLCKLKFVFSCVNVISR